MYERLERTMKQRFPVIGSEWQFLKLYWVLMFQQRLIYALLNIEITQTK